MLKLLKYRVTGFRSVKDSGWIETSDVTALIGVNESGKTNLLLPLWKLNPANDGKIDAIADFPRREFIHLRQASQDRAFIRAQFRTDDAARNELAQLAGLTADDFDIIEFSRRFDGEYRVSFPVAKPRTSIDVSFVKGLLDSLKNRVETELSEGVPQAMMLAAIKQAASALEGLTAVKHPHVLQVLNRLEEIPAASEEDLVFEGWHQCVADLELLAQKLAAKHPSENDEVAERALEYLPKFIYYSNYGNLDSEIYLPHVIENMAREGLGPKQAGQARTLKVLFEFVRLQPQEILDLGRSAATAAGHASPTQEEIDDAADRTRERSILLQSAGAELTQAFRDWWKQGDYRFRFEADGDHFRIWVADEKRPDEIELESRSTGLQWFLSFFLVFLVERSDSHQDAILLLDEPGLSLHPLAQKDLSAFFDGLAETNQLLFTTHSPFLVDPDRLDRVRSVFIDNSGATAVSANLRAGRASAQESKSVYAVHAALGLAVSDALLQGCTNVIVEGASDQHYLSAIKSVLISLGKLMPKRELLFIPGGGAKGVSALVPIFAGKDEAPPYVILDSDSQGEHFAAALKKGKIYSGDRDGRILRVGDMLPTISSAEVEDLFPQELLADVISRMLRGDDDFRDYVKPGAPIVPQIEAFAAAQSLTLEVGWKVELAKQVKQRLLKAPENVPGEFVTIWLQLFKPFSTES